MATYNKIQQFVEDLNHGVHNFTSDATCTITVALTADADTPDAALDAVLADITEVSYANLSSRVVTVASSGHTTGTYALVLTDLTLTASGAVATFRDVVHYNDDPTSPADPLIQYYSHTGDVTLANGETFDIDYGASFYTLA